MSSGLLGGVSGLAAAADHLAMFAARRIVDRAVMPTADQLDAVRRTADFYTTPAFLDDPRSFFPFLDTPVAIPDAVADRRNPGDGATRQLAIRFESPYQPLNLEAAEHLNAVEENRIVRAHWRMHDGNHPRKVVIALHGFGTGSPRADQNMLLVPGLYETGLDIAFMTFPFHGKRGPAGQRLSGSSFVVPDIAVINEGMAQAVHDLAALIAWLRNRGVPQVGLIGMSLGGYLAALAAELLNDLEFVVAMAAPANFGDLAYDFMANSSHFRDNPASAWTREELDSFFQVHCPLAHPAPPSNEHLMLVRGDGDRIVPRSHTESLADHWNQPELHVAPAGHLLPVGRVQTTDAVVSFLRKIGVV
jgi:pimeloyl-ACP methyl ester carboxylesterase